MTQTFTQTVTQKARSTVEGYRRVRAAARASLFWALLSRQRRWVKWLFVMLFITFGLVIVSLILAFVVPRKAAATTRME